MSTWLITIALALSVWWLGTGVVLYLHQTLSRNHEFTRNSLIGVATLCLVALVTTQHGTNAASIVASFIAAVTLWGVVELSYYLGYVTGVHTRPCPPDIAGVDRFRLALGTSVWHELMVLTLGVALTVLLFSSSNPTGLLTFLVLWLMRWSAKLNLFLGVPHFQPDWFPVQFHYLKSYLKRSPVSWFFPLSIGAALLVMGHWIQLSISSTGANVLTHSLPAALLALAIVEHGLMAVPVSESRLWNTTFNTRKTTPDQVKR